MGSASGMRVTVCAVVLFALLKMQSLTMVAAVQKCSKTVKCLSANNCCSVDGYCGTTSYYCGPGCQSGPCYFSVSKEEPTVNPTVAQFVPKNLFDLIFPARNEFYTYEALLDACEAFPAFGSTGSLTAQKRDIAAFLAHIHHETAGLTTTTAGDTSADFCAESDATESFKCVPGKKYFARGPMQLTWNYNYGSASDAVGADILKDPQLVSEDVVISFKSALWVWMSPALVSTAATDGSQKPSGHQVMVGQWTPSSVDIVAGRSPGFGATIAVLTGKEECGRPSAAADARTKTYLQITNMMGVSAGPNLGCESMLPF